MPSREFTLFSDRKKRDVLEIANVFDEINNRRGPNVHYSLLNGALVLLISSWEVYCEDVCRQASNTINERNDLRFASFNEQFRRDLIKYAGSQYSENRDPLEEKIASLVDGGWKQLVVDRLHEYLPDFNTPKFSRQRGKDLDQLFRQILGIRMSNAIEDLLEEQGICRRLDDVVTLRGAIAHTGEAPANARLTSDDLRQHTSSFVEAAAAVDVIFHQEFRNRLGFAPWQITQPVRDALRPAVQDKI